MKNNTKPIIGIISDVDVDFVSSVKNDYVKAIEASGGTPILLPYSKKSETSDSFIELCDGFLFSGGNDIEPIRYGEETIEGDFLFGSVSNSMSVGGIIKLDPNAVELNDGLFEVLLIKNPANLSQLNRIVNCILKKDFSDPNVCFFRTDHLSVTAARDIPWTLDGEQAFPRKNDFEISNLHSAISFYVPDND